MFSLEIGLSLIFTLVWDVIRAASAPGLKDVTTRSILLPMMLRDRTSPLANALPSSTCARYSSPPCSLSSSVGEKVIFSASFTSAFFTSTLSSMDTPALRLVDPSSLMMPLLASSGAPLRTLTAVFLFPVTMTMSPTLMPSMSISSGSSLATPFPASPGLSSATLIALSLAAMSITLCSSYPICRLSFWRQRSR